MILNKHMLQHHRALQGMTSMTATALPQVHAGGSGKHHPARRHLALGSTVRAAAAAAEAGQGAAVAAAGGAELDEEEEEDTTEDELYLGYSGPDTEEEADGDFGDGLEEQSYTAVSTADLEALGLSRHPDAIAECASLRWVCGGASAAVARSACTEACPRCHKFNLHEQRLREDE